MKLFSIVRCFETGFQDKPDSWITFGTYYDWFDTGGIHPDGYIIKRYGNIKFLAIILPYKKYRTGYVGTDSEITGWQRPALIFLNSAWRCYAAIIWINTPLQDTFDILKS